ncbi:TPR domain protein [Annulohypoxylon truncatum]|uniref:TPR domain protein n=1 Tax=Annulohypoxylon truncatum TaxID=327061 RepID=UPI002008B18D|nr:TPR domain protein [Annulohypoxylon truncatum]KAI1210116.1 TPR domain protein [Annulohypoxylon truncatum]
MAHKSNEASADQLDQDYYDLGSYERPVSSNSEEAREWANRGLIWSYAFNHEESAKCFERAIASDADCVFAYWGLAYVLGPNYNKPWEFFDETELDNVMRRTRDAIAKAKASADKASPVERALVDALKYRYPPEEKAADRKWSIWNASYADAMGGAYKLFPDDLDVATLYVDALMNLTPWQLWDLDTGAPAPGARTLEAKAILERAMAQDGSGAGSRHPGLLHLYIHLMEMSPTPEAALPAANTLRALVPDAGHLNHMPTHIDVLVGDYQAAIASNQAAIIADNKFFARESSGRSSGGGEGQQPVACFYTLYRMHDLHFRLYAAMFAGSSRAALDTASAVEKALPESLLRVESPPMADWLEGFAGMRAHALVRFGMWDEVLEMAEKDDGVLYCATNALICYAKGMAYAAKGDVERAREKRVEFAERVKRVPESRTVFNNKCVDILGVAEAMLDGELKYREGRYEDAFEHLRTAVQRSAALPYDEPWGWMQPPAHALGALLVEQGHFDKAVEVYADDLGISEKLPRALQHRNNVWALHGYHECLVKLGRLDEAKRIKPQLDKAIEGADIPIKASCYCRLSVF